MAKTKSLSELRKEDKQLAELEFICYSCGILVFMIGYIFMAIY